jgi:hypothetical protein
MVSLKMIPITKNSKNKIFLISRFFCDAWPAFAVLLSVLFIAVFVAEFTFLSNIKSLWKVLFRFLRLSFILILPILVIPYICVIMSRLLHTKHGRLIQLQEERTLEIDHIQVWLLKPLQGIALIMLLAVKLIGFLQIYVDESITGSVIIPAGQFHLTWLLSANIILIVASIFLLFIWTLDGLGIRYYNTKSGEVRMVGKYIGVLLPIIFSLYGMITLFKDSDRYLAIWNILQIILVLYSPFVMLAVVHFLYIRSKEAVLIKRLNVLKQHPPRSDLVKKRVRKIKKVIF